MSEDAPVIEPKLGYVVTLKITHPEPDIDLNFNHTPARENPIEFFHATIDDLLSSKDQAAIGKQREKTLLFSIREVAERNYEHWFNTQDTILRQAQLSTNYEFAKNFLSDENDIRVYAMNDEPGNTVYLLSKKVLVPTEPDKPLSYDKLTFLSAKCTPEDILMLIRDEVPGSKETVYGTPLESPKKPFVRVANHLMQGAYGIPLVSASMDDVKAMISEVLEDEKERILNTSINSARRYVQLLKVQNEVTGREAPIPSLKQVFSIFAHIPPPLED